MGLLPGSLSARLFQPTSPVRETTGDGQREAFRRNHFNPRPPCGRRRPGQHAQDRRGNISTHVPRAGDDPGIDRIRRQCGHFNPRPPCGRRRALGYVVQMCKVFQPTSPVRETTTCGSPARPVQLISTHVPRAGDDPRTGERNGDGTDFNPRPPCGRRPSSAYSDDRSAPISTHVPRAGDDEWTLRQS